MICKPCRIAARERFVFRNGRTAEIHHAHCKGGTWCDCQHDITQSALNMKVVSRAPSKEA